ncbi:MAG: hypothetical protein GY795_24900 [Desulfobacterales bacterium]|nr:hypothetical protein [Desulfobacterales bacterium]
MAEKDFLKINPYRLIKCIKDTVDIPESEIVIEKLKDELNKHVKKLLMLSKDHLRFSNSIKNKHAWRQKISRAYYSCYLASRAMRLGVEGTYDQSVTDHKRISILPQDFEDRDIWSNFLTQFRSDRNLADYDHEKKSKDLEYPPKIYIKKANEFYRLVEEYLRSRGHI